MRLITVSLSLALLSLPLAASATTQDLSTGVATYVSFGMPAGATCANPSCIAVPVVGNPGWGATIPGATWVNFSGTDDYLSDNPNGQYEFVTEFFATAGSVLSGSFSSDNNSNLDVYGTGGGGAFLGHNFYGTDQSTYSFNTVTAFSTVLPSTEFYYLVDFLTNGQPDSNLPDGPNTDGPVGLLIGATVTSPTPEPSSLVLLGTGILGLAGAARRRLNK